MRHANGCEVGTSPVGTGDRLTDQAAITQIQSPQYSLFPYPLPPLRSSFFAFFVLFFLF